MRVTRLYAARENDVRRERPIRASGFSQQLLLKKRTLCYIALCPDRTDRQSEPNERRAPQGACGQTILSAGRGDERKNGPGGQHNPLKSLDSNKGIQGEQSQFL
jgi:hypothetical protein